MSSTLNVGTLTADISLDANPFFRDMKRAKAEFSGLKDGIFDAANSFLKFEVSLNNVADLGKKAALGIGAIGTAAVAAGGFMVKLASDADETRNVMDQVFGKGKAREIDAWAQATGDAMGRSTQQMREFSSTAMAMLGPMLQNEKKAGDMSLAVSKLAVDLGSLWNIADDDAFTKLRAGLSGESEPLRKLGVNLLEARLNQDLFNAGINKTMQDLSESEKVLVRWNAILRDTRSAQGDAERTSDSFANTLKAMKAEASELGEAMGRELIPVAHDFLRLGRDIIKEIGGGDMSTGFQTIGNAAKALADEVLLLGEVFGEVMGAIIQATTRATGNPFEGMLGSIGRLRRSLAGETGPGSGRVVGPESKDDLAGATHQQRLWGAAASRDAMKALNGIINDGDLKKQLKELNASPSAKAAKRLAHDETQAKREFERGFNDFYRVMDARARAFEREKQPYVDEFGAGELEFLMNDLLAREGQGDAKARRDAVIALEKEIAAERLRVMKENERAAGDLLKKTVLGQSGGSWTELFISSLNKDARGGMGQALLAPLKNLLGTDMIEGLVQDFQKKVPFDIGADAMAGLSSMAGAAGTALSVLGSAASAAGSLLKAAAEATMEAVNATAGKILSTTFKDPRLQSANEAFIQTAAISGGGPLMPVTAGLGLGMAAFQLSTETKSFGRFQDAMGGAIDKVVLSLEPFWENMMPLAGLFGATAEAMAPLLASLLPGPVVIDATFGALSALAQATLTTAGALVTLQLGALDFAIWISSKTGGSREDRERMRDERDAAANRRRSMENAIRDLARVDIGEMGRRGRRYADERADGTGSGGSSSGVNTPAGYKRRADELAMLIQDVSGGTGGSGRPGAGGSSSNGSRGDAVVRTADATEETNELLGRLIGLMERQVELAPGRMRGVSDAQQRLATTGTYANLGNPFAGRG